MKCPTCHAEIPDTAKFCNECGVAITQGVVEPAAPEAAPASSPQPAVTTGHNNMAALVAVCAVVVFAIWLFFQYQDANPHVETDAERLAKAKEDLAKAMSKLPTSSAPVSTEDLALQQLEVKDWSFVKTRGMPDEVTYEVSGKLLNKSQQYFKGVYLDVALLDKQDHVIATSVVHAANLSPGGTGIIEGYIMDKTFNPSPKGEIHVSNGF